MGILRTLGNTILPYLESKKAIIITGARQVGKTTLIEMLCEEKKTLWLTGDDPVDRNNLASIHKLQLLQMVATYDYLVIDEAQRIDNIGLTAKMIIDNAMVKQLFLSGSSALDLANKTKESLTGRKWEFNLYPLSWVELVNEYTFLQAKNDLPNYLLYGTYPEVLTTKFKKEIILKNLTNSYLYKDILELMNIKKPDLLSKLIQALALQIGNEVSYNELSILLQVDRQTIISYIDLLEKCFVVFRLLPYHTNQRKELTQKPKIYFYDVGVRNAVLQNFQNINTRNDIGALWENYCIAERIKKMHYQETDTKFYYWRNTAQAEIDLIEIHDNEIYAYEIKWSAKQKVKFSKSFTDLYQPKKTIAINSENFWEHF
jgi:uncharacterized protein